MLLFWQYSSVTQWQPPAGVFRPCGDEPPAATFLSAKKEMWKRKSAETTFLHFLARGERVRTGSLYRATAGVPLLLSVRRTVLPQLAAWRCRAPLPSASVGDFCSIAYWRLSNRAPAAGDGWGRWRPRPPFGDVRVPPLLWKRPPLGEGVPRLRARGTDCHASLRTGSQ